jgi:hypothetical protein
MYTGLTNIGIDVDLAGWHLTDNTSIPKHYGNFVPKKDNETWEGYSVVRQDKGYDLYLSIVPEIGIDFPDKSWFDCRLQCLKTSNNICKINSINDINGEHYGFKFCGNWVPYQGELKEKKYITQLIVHSWLCPDETKELLNMKKYMNNIIISGGELAPEGYIQDKEILPYTAMLVHNKKSGINCYAVCKALDYGIPVYMEKSTKTLIGFDDLPDELFIFREQFSIEEAYNIALGMDNKKIRDTYRSIYSLDRLKKSLTTILDRK